MIRLTRRALHQWLDVLLHNDDTPERTAAAFALGVLFGFSPLLGLHTLLAVAIAFLLNLNRVAVLLGVYANLPLTIGPYYTAAIWLGARITHDRLPPGFAARLGQLFELSLLHREFWRQLWALVWPLLWPYLVGSTIGALLLAAIAYPLALAFVTSERRIRHIIHHQKP